MSEHYTPTTEDVLSAFVGAAPTAGEATLTNRERAVRRWLTARDMLTKAEALREAADADWPNGMLSGASVERRLRELSKTLVLQARVNRRARRWGE